MSCAYGRDPIADAAVIVAECVRSGRSRGWAGTVEQREAVAAVLKPYGVRYTDDMHGEWSGPKTPKGITRVASNAGVTAFADHDSNRVIAMSHVGWALLKKIGAESDAACHVRGSEVAVARKLATLGLVDVKITSIGARVGYVAKPTPLGLEVIEAGATYERESAVLLARSRS